MQSPALRASEPPPPTRPPGGPASGPGALPGGLTLSRTAAVLLSVGVLAVVGIGDYLTEWYFLFDAFYLVPLVLVTVYAGRRAGTYMALACSLVWLVSLYPQRAALLAGAVAPSPLIWVWNFAGRFGLQTAFAWIIASLREEIAEQRRLVTELHAASTRSRDCRSSCRYAPGARRSATIRGTGNSSTFSCRSTTTPSSQ